MQDGRQSGWDAHKGRYALLLRRRCRFVHRYFLRVAVDEQQVLQGIAVPDHRLPSSGSASRRTAGITAPCAAAKWPPCAGPTSTLSGDDDVVVTVRRSKTNPAGDRADVRRLVGGCAAAVRRLHAATSPTPTEAVIGLAVHQINRRFAAACAAAGLEGRRTSVAVGNRVAPVPPLRSVRAR